MAAKKTEGGTMNKKELNELKEKLLKLSGYQRILERTDLGFESIDIDYDELSELRVETTSILEANGLIEVFALMVSAAQIEMEFVEDERGYDFEKDETIDGHFSSVSFEPNFVYVNDWNGLTFNMNTECTGRTCNKTNWVEKLYNNIKEDEKRFQKEKKKKKKAVKKKTA